MEHSGTILAALLVVLTGCSGGVPKSAPTDTAPETGTNSSTSTPTSTPVPTECRSPTPVPNPDTITHHIGISNDANESYVVTVTVSGKTIHKTRSKTMGPRSAGVAMNITESGTYTLRAVTKNGPELNATIEPPYGKWPTVNPSASMITINQNRTITIENVHKLALPTPVCS